MIGALLYLQLTSMKGRLLSRLKRLKQPKYLLGAVVGILYFYFFFFRRPAQYRNRNLPEQPVPEDFLAIIAAIGALVLLTIAILSWLLPRARAGLAFSEAEIAFLFPAPVKRRTLIHYRLLSSQFGLALTALILTLLSNRWSVLGGNAVTHAFGWWIMLATLNLHLTGSSFAITRLMDRGIDSLRRSLIGVAIVALVIAGIALWIRSTLRAPNAEELTSMKAIVQYVTSIVESGPLYWLLWIPGAALGPFLAPDVRGFFVALGPALLVLVGHYFWVMRTEVAFEEASLAKAEKRAAKRNAIMQGRVSGKDRKGQRDPFRLAALGRPEIAFLWKNLLSTTSLFRPRVFLIAAAIIAGLCLYLLRNPALVPLKLIVSGISTTGGLVLAFMGPQMVRTDLRADLPNSDILKTYPLTGWQVVFGELLAPIAMLSGMLWLLILAAAFAFPEGPATQWLTPPLRASIAAGLALLAPPFIAMQLLVPNAAAIIFPAWSQSTGNRGEHGLDVMGQRIIFFAGQMLIVAIALIPCAIVAAVSFFVVRWFAGIYVGAAVALLAVLGILLGEVWVGVRVLGNRFERFDLSSELRP